MVQTDLGMVRRIVDALYKEDPAIQSLPVALFAAAMVTEEMRRTGVALGMLQPRVRPWMLACFGEEISADKVERRHRFTEEALELLQAMGGTRDEAVQLVDYVFSRPAGEPVQEVGGVMITLAALCLAAGVNMHAAGEVELARIWTKVEEIRAKQAAKPKFSVLPIVQEPRHE